MPKDLTPCECSKFEAVIAADLTEENLASGDYEVFTTGCDEKTASTFSMGHDAKLKSFLIRYGSGEYEVSRTEDGVRVGSDAAELAKRYKFAHMVVDGIKRAQNKAARKQAKKATPKKPKTVTAKVGRWLREGVINGDEFVYVDAKGNEKRVTKFAVQD